MLTCAQKSGSHSRHKWGQIFKNHWNSGDFSSFNLFFWIRINPKIWKSKLEKPSELQVFLKIWPHSCLLWEPLSWAHENQSKHGDLTESLSAKAFWKNGCFLRFLRWFLMKFCDKSTFFKEGNETVLEATRAGERCTGTPTKPPVQNKRHPANQWMYFLR